MNKISTKKHIELHTCYIDADRMIKFKMTPTNQIQCQFKDELKGHKTLYWKGEIQKIYLDKDGEATGYDVYVY